MANTNKSKFCVTCDKAVTVAKDRVTCHECGSDLLNRKPLTAVQRDGGASYEARQNEGLDY